MLRMKITELFNNKIIFISEYKFLLWFFSCFQEKKERDFVQRGRPSDRSYNVSLVFMKREKRKENRKEKKERDFGQAGSSAKFKPSIMLIGKIREIAGPFVAAEVN